MEIPLEEVLEAWAMYNCPALLCDEELLTKLLLFIHGLMLRAAREERRQTMLQILKAHPC